MNARYRVWCTVTDVRGPARAGDLRTRDLGSLRGPPPLQTPRLAVVPLPSPPPLSPPAHRSRPRYCHCHRPRRRHRRRPHRRVAVALAASPPPRPMLSLPRRRRPSPPLYPPSRRVAAHLAASPFRCVTPHPLSPGSWPRHDLDVEGTDGPSIARSVLTLRPFPMSAMTSSSFVLPR